MKIVGDVISFIALVAIAAVVFLVLSSAGGLSDLGVSRADGQQSHADRQQEVVVDAQGNLHVPSNYRTAYEFLGAWAIAAENGAGSSALHIVYATRGTTAAYHATGHFPEGTVLIKEVHETATAPMATGTISRAQTLKGWFVMVKDSRNSHPNNPLWGDGWGWSWFDAGNPTKTTSTSYKKDCLACHVPAQATDWIYTSGYPPLR
jgi:hypothetical protein